MIHILDTDGDNQSNFFVVKRFELTGGNKKFITWI